MSTRLSTEALEEIGAFFGGAVAQQLIAEVEASWKERDAARRALRDLTADAEKVADALRRLLDAVPWNQIDRYHGAREWGEEARDALVALDAGSLPAARAVLSENPKEPG